MSDTKVPGVRLHYDPRYYAANVLDPDGYSLEFVYKSWQQPSHHQLMKNRYDMDLMRSGNAC